MRNPRQLHGWLTALREQRQNASLHACTRSHCLQRFATEAEFCDWWLCLFSDFTSINRTFLRHNNHMICHGDKHVIMSVSSCTVCKLTTVLDEVNVFTPEHSRVYNARVADSIPSLLWKAFWYKTLFKLKEFIFAVSIWPSDRVFRFLLIRRFLLYVMVSSRVHQTGQTDWKQFIICSLNLQWSNWYVKTKLHAPLVFQTDSFPKLNVH